MERFQNWHVRRRDFRRVFGSPLLAVSLLILILSLTVIGDARGAPAQFRFQAGKSYVYEVKVRVNSDIQAYETRDSKSEERIATMTVRAISYARGIWVLDFEQDGRRGRRYMRDNGQIVMASGELPWELPFFVTLPAGEPAPNKVFRTETVFPLEKGTVPARWELACRSYDQAKGRITYALAGTVALASDQMIKRSLAVKGGFAFDQTQGVCDAGEWTLTYSLETANKEFAVIRPLWTVNETRKIAFRLLEVTK